MNFAVPVTNEYKSAEPGFKIKNDRARRWDFPQAMAELGLRVVLWG